MMLCLKNGSIHSLFITRIYLHSLKEHKDKYHTLLTLQVFVATTALSAHNPPAG